jgi:hypothetical protein
MEELMMRIATIFPEEFLVEQLQEKINLYNADPTENNYAQLLGACHIMLMKDVIKHNGGVENLLNKVRTMDVFAKYVDPERAKDNG